MSEYFPVTCHAKINVRRLPPVSSIIDSTHITSKMTTLDQFDSVPLTVEEGIYKCSVCGRATSHNMIVLVLVNISLMGMLIIFRNPVGGGCVYSVHRLGLAENI